MTKLKISEVRLEICSHDLTLTAGCFTKKLLKKKKIKDNHQCLHHVSSKRLKAHIADNWIWFALPASVGEIKAKHKNPHDSFSSGWQARPDRSWKECLWWKPSSRLLTQWEVTVPRNNGNIIKTQIITGVWRIRLILLQRLRVKGWSKQEFLKYFTVKNKAEQ